MTRIAVRGLLLGCALAMLASAAFAGDDLSKKIDAIIDAPEFKHAHWGLLVVDAETGDTFYERSADKLFAPASTTKLYSVASALDALGADYRFETPIYARGEVDKQGRLAGDLILVASGDLSMGGRTDDQGKIAFMDSDHTYAGYSSAAELTAPDPLAGLDDLARQVAAAGIKSVSGDILIDNRLFDSAQGTGSGPDRLTPIMINDNLIDVEVSPSEPGKPAKIVWRPQTQAVRVDAQVETVDATADTRVDLSSPSDGVIVVRGQIASNAKPVVRIYEAPDAPSFARTLLIEALARAGVRVDAPVLDADNGAELPNKNDYPGLKRVALIKSPPFGESIKLILKVSHNLHASTLPLIVAARHGQRTLAAGLRKQHDFLARNGVDVDSISFGGGAGGDRADYVTPRATVQLLRYMATRPDFEVYKNALPTLGVDGTLAKSVGSDSPARGKIQAKTGTLTWSNVMNGGQVLNSKALAGYGATAEGKPFVFAAFVNQTMISKPEDRDRIGRVLGTICETIHADKK